jgi:hypothetical protein
MHHHSIQILNQLLSWYSATSQYSIIPAFSSYICWHSADIPKENNVFCNNLKPWMAFHILLHMYVCIYACIYVAAWLSWKTGKAEKYVSICSDSLAALKALQAARTTPPVVQRCQKSLNVISTQHSVGLYLVPGHAGLRGNEIADKLARDGSVQEGVVPESSLGVSRQIISRKIRS